MLHMLLHRTNVYGKSFTVYCMLDLEFSSFAFKINREPGSDCVVTETVLQWMSEVGAVWAVDRLMGPVV